MASGMPRRAVPVLIAVFLAALVGLMPLRIVLGWAGGAMSARYVDGPVWWGRAYDLRIGPVPVGTVDAGLRPLPLLIGRAETWLERPGGTGQAPLRARIGAGGGGLHLADANGSLPLPEDLGQLPASTIGFDQFEVDFAKGQCRSASGSLTVTLAPVSVLMPRPLSLTGKARCQDGALVVPMAAVLAAMQPVPSIRLRDLGYNADGTLHFTAAAPRAEDVNAVLIALQNAGWKVTVPPSLASDPTGATVVAITVRAP